MSDLRSRLQESLGDRYRILHEAGSGGTGVVFIAEDLKHGRSVALKVLRPEVGRSLGADRFLREIRIASQLHHPNIVSLIDSGEADGLLYYVMFHVEGESLRDRLAREKQLPVEEALRIGNEVADALGYAHEHGVIHRDIKPENILFEAGHAVVADFGIARAIQDAGAERLTETGLAIGTPAYMSPEQAAGADVDVRTDVYSLACVLYEMLAGSPPWDGATPQVILARKTLEPAPGLRVARSTVPVSVERAIAGALSATPADRPPTIDEFVKVLSAAPVQRPVWRTRLSSLRLPLLLTTSVVVTVVLIGTVARFTNSGSTAPPAAFQQLTSEPGVEDAPCLSPDGEWLVYAGDGGGDRDIFLRSTGGERGIPLTDDSTADDTQPVFSPDGNRIAFRSDRDGGGIFVMGRTGEGVRRVTDRGYNPDWSPDGTRLVYAMENVGLTPLNWELRSALWIVDVDGGAPHRISEGDAVDPSWSPNGQRIAYTTRWAEGANGLEARMDIVTIPVAGGEPVPVTADAPTDWSPAWSADGRYIYFASDRGGSMNLWRVRVDEKSGRALDDPRPITVPATFVAHPCASTDGRHIVFSNVSTPTQNVQKATFDPATGQIGAAVWLTSGTRRWANPDPTPDGGRVVLYSQDRPEGDLYVIRGDGTGLRQLTGDSAIDRVPRWSPDGSLIQYFSNRSGPLELWMIRPDGSDNRQISRGGAGVGVWSPDGSRLLGNSPEGVSIFDPSLPSDGRHAEALAPPDSALAGFKPNDWSSDGRHLTGSVDYQDTGIVTYSFSAREYRKLTDFGKWPVFLPDNRRILFVSGGNTFYIVDMQTGEVTSIYSTPWDVLGPPRLTRDGREIYFSRRVTEGDVWLVTLQ